LETYELVNRAFRQLPPPELHRLLVNRLDATPLAGFLADPQDNLQLKKLTRQQLRADPAFAEELIRAIATAPAPTFAVRTAPPPEIGPRRKKLPAVLVSGMAAILLALFAVLLSQPRSRKWRNPVSS
jgi:hypothetical protein